MLFLTWCPLFLATAAHRQTFTHATHEVCKGVSGHGSGLCAGNWRLEEFICCVYLSVLVSISCLSEGWSSSLLLSASVCGFVSNDAHGMWCFCSMFLTLGTWPCSDTWCWMWGADYWLPLPNQLSLCLALLHSQPHPPLWLNFSYGPVNPHLLHFLLKWDIAGSFVSFSPAGR